MPNKTKYFTAVTIWMVCLSIAFAIPTLINGINVGKNVQDLDIYNQRLANDSYFFNKFEITESNRIYLSFHCHVYNETTYFPEEKSIILSIMNEENFENWINAGTPEPAILNSTYYFYNSRIDVSNLQIPNEDFYYFVFYNNDDIELELSLEITIIPWGFIIPTSITGFLLSFSFLVFIIKILTTRYYNLKSDKDRIILAQSEPTSREHTKEKSKTEVYCQSCGAPITPKDGRYCHNCGASI